MSAGSYFEFMFRVFGEFSEHSGHFLNLKLLQVKRIGLLRVGDRKNIMYRLN